jgi:hypothetical protein
VKVPEGLQSDAGLTQPGEQRLSEQAVMAAFELNSLMAARAN